MIIFVEGNKVDISEFINGFKSSIAFIGDKLKVNLDVAKDKIKVIEEMHRIMCEQDKKISVLKEKLDSGREDCCCKSNESQIENLKERNKYLSEQVKELSRLNSEKEYANIKLKYDSLVDQVRELSSLNLNRSEKIINLEVDKKKLYDELQKEKAINRDLEMQLEILLRAIGLGW